MVIKSPESLAYVVALVVNFIDQMGGQFIVPVVGADEIRSVALHNTTGQILAVRDPTIPPRLCAGRRVDSFLALLTPPHIADTWLAGWLAGWLPGCLAA